MQALEDGWHAGVLTPGPARSSLSRTSVTSTHGGSWGSGSRASVSEKPGRTRKQTGLQWTEELCSRLSRTSAKESLNAWGGQRCQSGSNSTSITKTLSPHCPDKLVLGGITGLGCVQPSRLKPFCLLSPVCLPL